MTLTRAINTRFFYNNTEFTEYVYSAGDRTRANVSTRPAMGRPRMHSVITKVTDGYSVNINAEGESIFDIDSTLVIWYTDTDKILTKPAIVTDRSTPRPVNNIQRMNIIFLFDGRGSVGTAYIPPHTIAGHYYRVAVYSTELGTLTIGTGGDTTAYAVPIGMSVSSIYDKDEYAINISGIKAGMKVFIVEEEPVL